LDQIRKFKVLFARYQRSRDLISVGAYAPGSDPVLDQAISLYPRMESFLQQQLIEQSDFPSSLEALKTLF
jgi:flagellum-specific ATP synthase